MSGTRTGALKSWVKRKKRGDHLNRAFYERLGRSSHVGGFGADPEFARRMALERWQRERLRRESGC